MMIKLKAGIHQIYYNKDEQRKDRLNNKKLKNISKHLDKIIDIILSELSNSYPNVTRKNYSYYIDDESYLVELKYETNVYGKQPRHEIHISKPAQGNWRAVLFHYYHGEINKFTSFFESVNTKTTEISLDKMKVFVDAILWLTENRKMSPSVKNKIYKYILKLKNDKLMNSKNLGIITLPIKRWYEFWR